MGGSAFAIGAQLSRVVLNLTALVVLSRLLLPEDFGLVASLAPIVAFITMFQDLGFQQTIIQREETSDKELNGIFWLISTVGLICALILSASSGAIASFYNDDRLQNLAIAASVSLFLTGVATVPLSVLNRDLMFKKMALIDVSANAMGFIAAVCGAIAGLGYWSLILTPIVISAVNSIGGLSASNWKPSQPAIVTDKGILTFGANLSVYNMMNFAARNFDNILIGRTQGAAELGYYDRAYKLLLFPIVTISHPLFRVAVPILSRVTSEPGRVRAIYCRFIAILSFAAVPAMAVALGAPDRLVVFLFGAKWLPLVPIFMWLGFAGLVQPINTTASWIFVSLGKSKQMVRWGMFSSCSTIVAIAIGLRWGAVGVAAAYAITEVGVRTPAMYHYISKLSPVKKRDFYSIQLPLLFSAGMTVSLIKVADPYIPEFCTIPFFLCCAMISYIFGFVFISATRNGREAIGEVWNLLGSALRRLRQVRRN
ncbi:hypothetical protein NS277_04215 [Novosphingobium barchaimii]|nr:hypothetical protein NS277_04215 [Novosphingobium barchaimii]